MPIIAQWKNRHTEFKLAELNTENLAILTKLDLLYQIPALKAKRYLIVHFIPKNGILWIPMSNAKKILIQECAALKADVTDKKNGTKIF